MRNNFIAFIDILGTRDIAKYDAGRYFDLMYKFQSVLIESSEALNNDTSIKIYFFSDCAYLQSNNISELIQFLKMVRDELLKKEIYLKGAITSGKLGIEDDLTKEQRVLFDKSIKLKKILQGKIFFSKDISRVYGFQENIKGIGIYIDKELIQNSFKKKVVSSFYLPDVNSNNVSIFTDIGYITKELDDREIERIFQNYLMSNTKSKRYGRMFLTIIASIINSTNFTKIYYEKETDSFIDAPFILNILLGMPKKLPHLYSTAKGISFIYLLLINKVYTDKADTKDDATYRLASKIIKLNRFISRFSNNFDVIPDDILEGKNKTKFINDFNKYHLERFRT